MGVSGGAGRVRAIKCGCAVANSGVEITANYCSKLGLHKFEYLFELVCGVLFRYVMASK